MIYVGIDTGVNTGVAVWSSSQEKFINVTTTDIVTAMTMVSQTRLNLCGETAPFCVVYEDARLRKWFGYSGREKLQGAGSVKRDASIWETFLRQQKIDFIGVAPSAGRTKWTAETFAQATGYTGRTNEHGRDAALLVWNKDEAWFRMMKETQTQKEIFHPAKVHTR